VLRSNLTGAAAIVFRPLLPCSSSAATLRTSSVASIYSGISSCSLRLPISAAPDHFWTADFVDPATCCRSFPPYPSPGVPPPRCACPGAPVRLCQGPPPGPRPSRRPGNRPSARSWESVPIAHASSRDRPGLAQVSPASPRDRSQLALFAVCRHPVILRSV
jgi:hypothetical protein